MKYQENPISFNDRNELWLLLRNGKREGLEGLYRLFAHELFKYGLALVNDADFVQDCIQEVFLTCGSITRDCKGGFHLYL